MSDIFRIDPFEDLEKVMNVYCKCLLIFDEYGIYLTKLKASAIFQKVGQTPHILWVNGRNSEQSNKRAEATLSFYLIALKSGEKLLPVT
jgi:hypothetical protein